MYFSFFRFIFVKKKVSKRYDLFLCFTNLPSSGVDGSADELCDLNNPEQSEPISRIRNIYSI